MHTALQCGLLRDPDHFLCQWLVCPHIYLARSAETPGLAFPHHMLFTHAGLPRAATDQSGSPGMRRRQTAHGPCSAPWRQPGHRWLHTLRSFLFYPVSQSAQPSFSAWFTNEFQIPGRCSAFRSRAGSWTQTSPALPFLVRERLSPRLRGCPFALCQAFPGSDYYGGSVALGSASRRRSHLYACKTLSTCRCLVRFLPSPQR